MERALDLGERAVQLAEDAALAGDAFEARKTVAAVLAFMDPGTRTRLGSMTTRLTGLRQRYEEIAGAENGMRTAA